MIEIKKYLSNISHYLVKFLYFIKFSISFNYPERDFVRLPEAFFKACKLNNEPL